jgi:hypothetical protein
MSVKERRRRIDSLVRFAQRNGLEEDTEVFEKLFSEAKRQLPYTTSKTLKDYCDSVIAILKLKKAPITKKLESYR